MPPDTVTPVNTPAADTPSTTDALRRASLRFGELVHAIGDDQWDLPTPCADWTVRDLVNHVTAENLWTAPLLEGRTIAEVGDAYDGDVLGADPVGSWDAARASADAALDGDGVVDRTVHLSFGDAPAGEYLWQLTADHLIHGWDLAQGTGAHDRLDAGLVTGCAAWFDGVEDMYRDAGAIGPRPSVAVDADAQTRLLARFGRSATLAAVGRFNAAFATHDVDAVMTHVTDDCVFDTTFPPPDGRHYEGSDAVAGAWREFFDGAPTARFDVEEIVAADDRAIIRWVFHWDDGHVRGVDVMRVREGKVAEKLSYVKG